MGSTDIIAIAVIALVVGAAVGYIIWAKKRGKKCIGCPYASSCQSGKCSCSHAETDCDKRK